MSRIQLLRENNFSRWLYVIIDIHMSNVPKRKVADMGREQRNWYHNKCMYN